MNIILTIRDPIPGKLMISGFGGKLINCEG